ncbi:MAG: hypothetical protein ACLR1V_06785 [Coprococcus sp.]
MKLFCDRIHEKYMTTEEVPDRLCDVIEQSEVIRRVHGIIWMILPALHRFSTV